MRRGSFPVDVEPGVLRWLVTSSGWRGEELSRRMGIPPQTLDSWLQGTAKPEFKDLERLSNILKRPLASFFLPAPPDERLFPRDYRTLPGGSGTFTRKTILALRRARRIQTVSGELMRNLNHPTSAGLEGASTSESAESVAERERRAFGIAPDAQISWKNSHEAFSKWRELVAGRNIIVLQLRLPTEDARGFSLADREPYVIVVSSSDTVEARIFTLLHEYGHLLLRDGGICDPEGTIRAAHKAGGPEKWCNEFAAALLLPKSHLKAELEGRSRDELLERGFIRAVSRRYKVSKSALLLHMLKNGYISQTDYDDAIERIRQSGKKPEGFGALPAERRVIQERGRNYVSLVMRNLREGNISRLEALEYLSIKLPKFEKTAMMVE